MADRTEWKECERQILAALDVRSEYEAMGVAFARDRTSASGWLACHAVDREDNNASAAVNVSEGPLRGRYRDMGGEGLSLSFWDFAARFGHYSDWREARRHFAGRTGVRMPVGSEPHQPRDQVYFLKPSVGEVALGQWATIKGGFDLDAVKAVGGLYGRYPKRAKAELAQSVAAFPAYNGPEWLDGEPCAWVVARTDGKEVELFRGRDKPPARSKTLSVGGSTGGLLGRQALCRLCPPADLVPGDLLPGETLAEGELPRVDLVWKVEGLSDLLCLTAKIAEAGYAGRHVAISNSQGCLETVKREWVELLRGHKVNVVGDADRPGQQGADRWCGKLSGVAAEVRNVALPYPVEECHGQDVRDFFAEGKTYADLLALADAAGPYQPAAAPAAVEHPMLPLGGAAEKASQIADPAAKAEAAAGHLRDLLKRLRLRVLGEYGDGSIALHSGRRRKMRTFGGVNSFSYNDLAQLTGPLALRHVHEGRESVNGKAAMSEVRLAIAYHAGQRQLEDQPPRGAGCWPFRDDAVLLVNGRKAALWRRGGLRTVSSPVVGGEVVAFEPKDGWCEFGRLAPLLDRAGDPAWAEEVWRRAEAFFALWKWKHPQHALVAAALAAATAVQTVWSYRPTVGLTGPSNNGKTLLCKKLAVLLRGLARLAGGASEAGIRQLLRHSAKVLLLDEFDKNPSQAKILEMLRASSRGTEVLRGTADQKGTSFSLRHMLWLSGIQLGLREEADQNRVVVLELRTLTELERAAGPRLPPDEEIAELGLSLVALAVRHCREAVGVAEKAALRQMPGVPARLVEGHSVPAALVAVSLGRGLAGAERLLADWLAGRSFAQVTTDEDALLQDLRHALVRGQGGQQETVVAVLTDSGTYALMGDRLEQAGMAAAALRQKGPRPVLGGCDGVFLVPELVRRHLLAGTRWESADLAALLLRLPGAILAQRTCGKGKARGVLLPRAALKLGRVDEAEGEGVTQPELPLLPGEGARPNDGTAGDARPQPFDPEEVERLLCALEGRRC